MGGTAGGGIVAAALLAAGAWGKLRRQPSSAKHSRAAVLLCIAICAFSSEQAQANAASTGPEQTHGHGMPHL